MILFGDLAPGAAVTIHGLREETGAGMTPVREALRRLTAEGALEAMGNRRLCVPRLSVGDLDEIRFARLNIEPELAERAGLKVTEAEINNLELLDKGVDEAIASGNVHKYLEYNYRFHFALYGAAQTSILNRIAHLLWLRAGPSLRVVCGRFGTSNLPDKHTEALAALRDRDPAMLRTAIREDIEQGLDQIRSAMQAQDI